MEFIRNLLATEAARFISYGTALAVWAAIKGSELVGSPIAPGSEQALAVATLATFILTEAIRHFVYSKASFEAK